MKFPVTIYTPCGIQPLKEIWRKIYLKPFNAFKLIVYINILYTYVRMTI